MTYPAIDPVAFYLFTWPVHWYGIMYLIGILGGWGLLAWRIKRGTYDYTSDQLSDIIFYAALGVIIGGRVGYMLFYDWQTLLHRPTAFFEIWKGGMSFHGGLLGVLIALAWYAKKIHRPFLALTDFIAPVVPIGLGAGRIGNFINAELWGRVTSAPWGMVFPEAGPLARHPSQLYEFFLEGVVMFVVLWVYSRKPRALGRVSGLFALCYGVFRFAVEFCREPDANVGYIAFGWMTEGQLLSLPLIVVGLVLLLSRSKGVA